MSKNNIQIEEVLGLKTYIISYIESKSGDKKHYSKATLNWEGYEIVLKSKYYKTLDEAVSGIKERIIKATIDFKL